MAPLIIHIGGCIFYPYTDDGIKCMNDCLIGIGCLIPEHDEIISGFKESAENIINKFEAKDKNVWFVLQGEGNKFDLKNISFDFYFSKLLDQVRDFENNNVPVFGFDINFNFYKDNLKNDSVIQFVSDLIIKIKKNSYLKNKKIAITLSEIDPNSNYFESEKNFIEKVNNNVILEIGENNLSLGICFDLINRFFDMNWVIKNTTNYNSIEYNIRNYLEKAKDIFYGLKGMFPNLSDADVLNLISITFKFFDLKTCFAYSTAGELINPNNDPSKCDYNNQNYRNIFNLVIADIKGFGIRHHGFWQVGSDYTTEYMGALSYY